MYFSIKDLSEQESITREEAKKLWQKYFLPSWGSPSPWLAFLMFFLVHAFTVNIIYKGEEFWSVCVSYYMQGFFSQIIFVQIFIIPAIASRSIRSELNKKGL